MKKWRAAYVPLKVQPTFDVRRLENTGKRLLRSPVSLEILWQEDDCVLSFVYLPCSQTSVKHFLFCNLALRRSWRPAGRTTCASGPRSRSWPTCWRNCPSSTAGSRILDISGNPQSTYRRDGTEYQGDVLNFCRHLLHPAYSFL